MLINKINRLHLAWHMVQPPPAFALSGAETLYNFMSQHRSLRAASNLGAKRNVLKRYERVDLLKRRGQWKQGDRVTGLRKTKGES